MIAPEQCDAVGPLGLQREESGEGFETVIAPVDKVTEKDVVCVRNLAARAEQLLQVVELAVDVAAYRHRRRDGLHVGLLQQKIADDITELLQRKG